MAEEVEHSCLYPATFYCCTIEGQRDKLMPDMEVPMRQRCLTEFLSTGKKKWHPLIYTNTSEYLQRPNRGCEHSETVGSAFQQCDSNMKYKSFWTAKHSSHTMKWRVRWADQDTSQLVAVTMLKKCFLAENLLYQIMLLRSLHLLEFTWE